MTAMNVSLTPELDRFVRDAVEGGRYLSSSEVVREALRLLQDRQRLEGLKLEALRAELPHGLDSGPAAPLNMEKVRARARAKLDQQRSGAVAS